MKCHTATSSDGFKFFLPGCWGGALYGIHRCTCYKPITKTKKDKEVDLEKECRMLRAINEKLQSDNRKLKDRIMEVERNGLPLHMRKELNDPIWRKYYLKKYEQKGV
jgi:hypothetical protein